MTLSPTQLFLDKIEEHFDMSFQVINQSKLSYRRTNPDNEPHPQFGFYAELLALKPIKVTSKNLKHASAKCTIVDNVVCITDGYLNDIIELLKMLT